MSHITFIPEPKLTFRHGQTAEDPRDGLTLFGPLDEGNQTGIRAGVIGTSQGIAFFSDWLKRIQHPQRDEGEEIARPLFPGFEAAFGVKWHPRPALSLSVSMDDITAAVNIDDRHQRVHATVSLFAERLLAAKREEEIRPDVWFVVIPDIIRERCRPQGTVPKDVKIAAPTKLNPRFARKLKKEPSLFEDWNDAAVAYEYDVDFRNQLKARLLAAGIVTQVVRESTLFPVDGVPKEDRPSNDPGPFQAAIAWNLSTVAFYKSGGRPWKVDTVRDGVCYVGLVFKRDERNADPRWACCAAQLFLDSGDGVVFKGNLGPWYSTDNKEFHLSRAAAKNLIDQAIKTYRGRREDGEPPRELFIHGRAMFSSEEWNGFEDAAAGTGTKLVGIRIRDDVDLRLFRLGDHPVLRGTAYIRRDKSAYLWTRGFAPRLRTYVGREVPRPLSVDIDKGDAPIETVLADIMSLTKLNYNTCLLSDGLPVTLRFADRVGEILTAGPVPEGVPLPFANYI